MTLQSRAKVQAYVICTSPRSGSTLLCGLLRAAGAGDPKSYFHQPDLAKWQTYFDLPSGGDSLSHVVQAARKRGSAGGLFGLRLQRGSHDYLMSQLSGLYPDAQTDTARIEASFGPMRFIHLTRENKLDQAISLVRAEMSGLWHKAPDGREIERLADHRDPVYDPERIQQTLIHLTRLDQAWQSWFATEGITPLRLTYDALADDPRSVLGQVLADLGRDPDAAQTVAIPTARLADDQSREWAARYRADMGLISE